MLFSLTANYFFGYSEEKNDRVMQAAINRSEANFTTEIKRLLESKRRPLPGSLLSSTNSKIPQNVAPAQITQENSKSNPNQNPITNTKNNANKKVVK